MKNFKLGFTLAEVLITLGIIGVVAAIVMPTVMTSYQYSTIGVKLSKFHQQTENAARAFAVLNDSITANNAANFIQETYMSETGAQVTAGVETELRDGTTLTATVAEDAAGINIPDGQSGIITLQFNPEVNGLPAAHRNVNYTFVVTDLGFVVPAQGQNCLNNIKNNGYRVSRQQFTGGFQCVAAG